jgi:hypothetical protein
MAVFWVVSFCSLAEVFRRYTGACCLHHQGDTTAILMALMIEAAKTSETSVNFYQTARHNDPEDSHLHTRRRKNLKSHIFTPVHILFTYLSKKRHGENYIFRSFIIGTIHQVSLGELNR